MIGFTLEPLDTLFFRDGTPFSSESSSQDYVGGQFPPSPLTIVGAVRAALARCNGWDGYSAWSDDLKSVLGYSPDDLGSLSFKGPFVVHQENTLYPMPRHLVGEMVDGIWTPRTFLSPGEPVCCDLGKAVRLPDLVTSTCNADVLKPAEGVWVRDTGFSAVLSGRLPGQDAFEVKKRRPWEQEHRIGLRRDNVTRTAVEGQLYSTHHVRLRPETKLGVYVEGIPDTWILPEDQILPLGGESRAVVCHRWNKELSFNAPLAQIKTTGRLLLVALTPLDIDQQTIEGHKPIHGFSGEVRVISACVDRPHRIGGWDSINQCPLPLRSLLPPGSVLFCAIEDVEGVSGDLDSAEGKGYLSIGRRREYGFGLVALSTWSE